MASPIPRTVMLKLVFRSVVILPPFFGEPAQRRTRERFGLLAWFFFCYMSLPCCITHARESGSGFLVRT